MMISNGLHRCLNARSWRPGSRRSAGVSGSRADDAKQWQDSGGVAGVAAQRGGDVAMTVGVQDANGEVAQAGHGSWGGASAGLGGVLGEGGVADVVQCLDAPPAQLVGKAGGACLGSGEAGDGVHRHGAPAAAGKRADPAGDPQGLGGVGEVQASDGGDLQLADLYAAMPAVASVVGDGDLAPGQGGELLVERGLVALHDQDVGGVLVGDQPVGVLTLGVERICGDDGGGQVQVVQQRPEPGDPPPAGPAPRSRPVTCTDTRPGRRGAGPGRRYLRGGDAGPGRAV